MKIICLFPGQGSYDPQYSDFFSGKNKEDFDLLAQSARHFLQPLIVGQSYLAWQELRPFLKNHQLILAGHSLGELSVLSAATAYPLGKIMEIARQRELMMREISSRCGDFVIAACLGALDKKAILAHCLQWPEKIWLMNNNSPDQVVVAYLKEHQDTFQAQQGILGIKKEIPIDMPVLSHVPLLQSMVPHFKNLLWESDVEARDSTFNHDVYLLSEQRFASDREDLMNHLAKQVANPVLFQEGIESLAQQVQPDCFIEIGPKKILSQLVKKIQREPVFSTESREKIIQLVNHLEGNISYAL